MNDLYQKALDYREYAAIKSNAYYATANHHRRNHMRLGVIATIVSALVGTALFAGLATRFNVDGKQPFAAPSGWAVFAFLIVAALSIASPILTGLQTFLKYAEQAEKDRSTAVGYDNLRQRLDLFMLRLNGTPEADRPTALKELTEIVDEFHSISQNSGIIPDRVYDAAVAKRPERAGTSDVMPR